MTPTGADTPRYPNTRMRVGVTPPVSQDTLKLASPLPIKMVTAWFIQCCFCFAAGAGRVFVGVQITGAMEGEIRERSGGGRWPSNKEAG